MIDFARGSRVSGFGSETILQPVAHALVRAASRLVSTLGLGYPRLERLRASRSNQVHDGRERA
ncbi:MAG: hypothetical protein ACRD34_14550, partial [Bryobacteraceae bacterium]